MVDLFVCVDVSDCRSHKSHRAVALTKCRTITVQSFMCMGELDHFQDLTVVIVCVVHSCAPACSREWCAVCVPKDHALLCRKPQCERTVQIVPTNAPVARSDSNDVVFRVMDGKWRAVVTEIKRLHEQVRRTRARTFHKICAQPPLKDSHSDAACHDACNGVTGALQPADRFHSTI